MTSKNKTHTLHHLLHNTLDNNAVQNHSTPHLHTKPLPSYAST